MLADHCDLTDSASLYKNLSLFSGEYNKVMCYVALIVINSRREIAGTELHQENRAA